MGCSRCMAHSAARARAPAHGESLPHGSNTRRHTRGQPCSPCGPVSPTTTTRACHSMLDRCTETAHEPDGLLTLHGTRQHEPVRLPTVSHCFTAQTHDATHAGSLARCVGLSPMTTPRESRACHTLDARSMHSDCARARWAAHAAWHSAARLGAPAHGESLPHGSHARRRTRAALLAVGLSPTTTPNASLPLMHRLLFAFLFRWHLSS